MVTRPRQSGHGPCPTPLTARAPVPPTPLHAELHPGMAGGFALLGFGQPGLDVVLLEHLDSSLYVEEVSDVERYTEAFERLTASALSFDQSLSLIASKKEACT
ncbi:Scr1 family TA system antitoxin-like transcriptional regulator [Streptomyces sp. NPDC052052]|uniref:Scr1 family TA system antitoxin-like transcriptional regulator n=1 Tax=Streptomyces sp. NPDC052052 TaxID=3154756 RepID=UPI003424F40A